jgi:hypothetical protein
MVSPSDPDAPRAAVSQDSSSNREIGLAARQELIDPEFRSGSLTAISVVVGFSLSFLSLWAGLGGRWQTFDLVAVLAIVLGIAFQIKALADLLSVGSLVLANYNRGRKIFLIGLALVAIGVACAIFADITGYGPHILGE